MSSMKQQYFAADDLRMLKRVLDHAGLYDRPDDSSRLARLIGARHLIACFQQRSAKEMELKLELHRHLHQDLAQRSVATELVDLQLWDNECSATEVDKSGVDLFKLRLVHSHSRLVQRVMLGFPAFSPGYHSPGTGEDFKAPQMLMMAA